ncbi:uncharacterized protein LOC107620066 [Arachis ipaensis]|uniref:uncharacterized protein LOC107620066 n=1 Tax=Arachis ipaensis TaxID=130454 RepID=UPI0007AFC9D3|nr:uncharacterized protein LOC107620066 [Arachis ipaensis]
MDDIDQSEIYDLSINLFSQVGSVIDHPLFLQSEIQGCLDVGNPNYECSICGACFCMFAFTSLGGKVLDSVNDGRGPPQFIITGQNYHRIGSLLPDAGQKPKFAQLYIYDTQHEIMHSVISIGKQVYSCDFIVILCFSSRYNVLLIIFWQTSEIDKKLITELMQMIDTHNFIAQSFRRVKEFYQCHPSEIFCLKLYSQRKVDRRIYSAPSCDEVAALIVGDFDSSDHSRDIIVRFTVPLLFPYGEDRYQLNIAYRGEQPEYVPGRRTRVSLREFICFRLQIREHEDGIIHKCRRLFQQFVVDCFTMIESQMLYEIRMKQKRERIPIADRPKISCRVFHAKLKCLLSNLKEGMYTIEFQKRGLPHGHMLLWFNGESNLQSVEIVDEFIYAELPNPQKFPSLYNVVTKYMIHGSCSRLRPSSPCMKDGKCSKFYPKRFVDQTSFDEDGYPIYRRRNMAVTVKINDVDIDNRFVVPYNPLLLIKYQAHINLEFCNKSNVIKYLFKYVNKGPDRVTATIGETYDVGESSQVVDEIKQYYDCRYLLPSESMWRIFAYDIHHRWPSVQRLTFHLPNQQHVVFDDADITTHVYLRNKDLMTMLRRGCTSFRSIRTVNGVTYDTVQEACFAMGFLIDDKEYVSAIKEVAELASAAQLRRIFVMLLLSGSMGRPLAVWEQTCAYLSADILYRRRHELQYPDLTMSQDELQTFCLLEIEKLLQSNEKSLRNYASMPVPNNYLVSLFSNLMLLRELQYDTVSNILKLNKEQRVVYDKIIDCVSNKGHEFFFVGIASLLLPSGNTAHSMFNIPVELTEDTVYRIKKDSPKAEVV